MVTEFWGLTGVSRPEVIWLAKKKPTQKLRKKIRDNSDKKLKTHKDLLVLKAGKTLVHARGYLATTNQPTTRNRTQAAEVGK